MVKTQWHFNNFSMRNKRLIETVPLAYDIYSSKQKAKSSPIIFLHGLLGNKLNNRSASRKLSKNLQKDVYCLDLRNHGSSPHVQRCDYPAMAADVEKFCIDHQLHHPILMGHSMGAKVAMSLALYQPELPSMVISIDNVPKPNENLAAVREFTKFEEYVEKLSEIEKLNMKSIKQADEALSSIEPDSLVRKFLLSNLKKDHSHHLHSRIPLDTISDSMEDISDFPVPASCTFAGPTLFIKGSRSPFFPDSEVGSVYSHFPNAQVETLDSGHWIVTEQPSQFVALVTDWISAHAPEKTAPDA